MRGSPGHRWSDDYLGIRVVWQLCRAGHDQVCPFPRSLRRDERNFLGHPFLVHGHCHFPSGYPGRAPLVHYCLIRLHPHARIHQTDKLSPGPRRHLPRSGWRYRRARRSLPGGRGSPTPVAGMRPLARGGLDPGCCRSAGRSSRRSSDARRRRLCGPHGRTCGTTLAGWPVSTYRWNCGRRWRRPWGVQSGNQSLWRESGQLLRDVRPAMALLLAPRRARSSARRHNPAATVDATGQRLRYMMCSPT
jgi:hypothetical protein